MNQLMKRFLKVIIIIILSSFASCDSVQDADDSSTASAGGSREVSAVSAQVTDTDVTLNWTDPTAQDIDHIEVACTNDSSLDQTVERGIGSCTMAGLVNGVAYTFRLRGVDAGGAASEGVEVAVSCGESDEAETIYFIHTVEELNAVRGGVEGYEDWGLDKHYMLMSDLDLSGYSDGSGWVPLSSESKPFDGIFNGNGHVIQNLTINRPNTSYQGLFGYIDEKGIVKGLKLDNVSIQADNISGGLTADNYGKILHCSVKGNITGSAYVGLIVGYNSNTGTVSMSVASGSVEGLCDAGLLAGANTNIISHCASQGTSHATWRQGGLVGWNVKTIEASFFTGRVTGEAQGTGGLVGANSINGEITGCHVVVDVEGVKDETGGLAGYNMGSISASTVLGKVTGTSYLGGLAGRSYKDSSITECHAAVIITGTGDCTGGLVGYANCPVVQCSAAGVVAGGRYSGGIAGYAAYEITDSRAWCTVTGTGDYTGGLAGYCVGDIINCEAGSVCSAKGPVCIPEIYSGFSASDDSDVFVKCSPAPDLPVLSTTISSTGSCTGGLAGRCWGDIIDSTVSGNVRGADYTGGLAGIVEQGNTILNCHGVNIAVTGANNTGGLAGYLGGYMKECTVSGSVEGVENVGGLLGKYGYLSGEAGGETCYVLDSSSSAYVKGELNTGGLLGKGGNGVRYSTASGTVEGITNTGGLIGFNDGASTWYCSASGCVKGESNTGGLVGYADAYIQWSFSTGKVSGEINTGGLVGYIEGSVFLCYSKGEVKGITNTGGLAGMSIRSADSSMGGAIGISYARGDVTGENYTGGLVGYKEDGLLHTSYATGMVEGKTDTGGLGGGSTVTATGCFYYQLPDNGIGTFIEDVTLMKDDVLYLDAGWDFIDEDANGTYDRWSISTCKNDGFPYLTEVAP